MRPLTLEAFKLMYILTGGRKFSYVFSLVLNTVMNVIVLKGLVVLTKEILPTGMLEIIFRFPFYIPLGLVLLFVNTKVVPLSMVDIVANIKTYYVKLIIYFVISVLLATFFYMDGRYF